MPETKEIFTPDSKLVYSSALKWAMARNHGYIGTEHIALGGSEVEDFMDPLRKMGVEVDKLQWAIGMVIGRDDTVPDKFPDLTPRAKLIMADFSFLEAQILGVKLVAPRHILLGTIREGIGIAAGVLESMGVTLERAREVVGNLPLHQ